MIVYFFFYLRGMLAIMRLAVYVLAPDLYYGDIGTFFNMPASALYKNVLW